MLDMDHKGDSLHDELEAALLDEITMGLSCTVVSEKLHAKPA